MQTVTCTLASGTFSMTFRDATTEARLSCRAESIVCLRRTDGLPSIDVPGGVTPPPHTHTAPPHDVIIFARLVGRRSLSMLRRQRWLPPSVTYQREYVEHLSYRRCVSAPKIVFAGGFSDVGFDAFQTGFWTRAAPARYCRCSSPQFVHARSSSRNVSGYLRM